MSIISNAKEVAELVKKLGNIDLYRRIVELEGEIVDLSAESHRLKQQVHELQEKLSVREQLQFLSRVYWLVEGETKTGPFCQVCYDADGKLIRLQDGTADDYDARSGQVLRGTKRFYRCLKCNAHYSDD